MQRSDEDLMLSCRDGDGGAFETLYRRYEKPVFAFIYRMVGSAADAEDLCQETFLKVVRAKKRYEARATFKTWLFQIALNLCRDRVRRMKFRMHSSWDCSGAAPEGSETQPQERIGDASSDPAGRAQTEEMQRLVQQAFATLPEEERTVVILKEYQALKFAEIAKIMKRPLGTVKSLNHRGRARLLEILSKYVD